MTDLHIHTAFSFDSEELPENYVLAAAARGDACLGFSEHYDFDETLGGGAPPDFQAYANKIDELNVGCVKVLKGIELGYSPSSLARYRELLQEQTFDYVICSVHGVEGRGDCFYPRFFAGLQKTEAYKTYLNAVLESVSADWNFQIVGHIGYIARYTPYGDKRLYAPPLQELVDEILKTVIGRGACLELNTSAEGLSGDFVPEISVVDRYIALGGRKFTFGSDAHTAARYMERADQVKRFLLSRGIGGTYRFERGKPVYEKF